MSRHPTGAPAGSRLERLGPELDAVDGTVSVWWGGLDGAASFTREPEARHYAASTMKLPVLLAAYRRADAGDIDLDAPVGVHNHFASVLDGSPYSVDHAEDSDDDVWAALGSEQPLRWLARRMIVRSSNLATNLVLEAVGVDAVAESLRVCRVAESCAVRGIEDYLAREHGVDNLVTAADLAAVLRTLGTGRSASAEATDEMLATLAANEWNDGIPAGLPAGTRVCHKNGWQQRVCHDAALLLPGHREPSVLVVLVTSGLDNDSANALTARIARAAWADQEGAG